MVQEYEALVQSVRLSAAKEASMAQEAYKKAQEDAVEEARAEQAAEYEALVAQLHAEHEQRLATRLLPKPAETELSVHELAAAVETLTDLSGADLGTLRHLQIALGTLAQRVETEVERLCKQHSEVPDALVCPITCAVFEDPVICADGHTYERCAYTPAHVHAPAWASAMSVPDCVRRAAISDWLQKHNTSPKTNEPLESMVMFPNHQVRQLVENYKDASAANTSTELPLTHEQVLNGRITDLMLNLEYPPDGDLLRDSTAEQVAAIWKAVGRSKCWRQVCTKHNGKDHSLQNLLALLLDGTTESTGTRNADLRARRLALCQLSGSQGILPRILLAGGTQ